MVIHKRDMVRGDVYVGRPSKWGNPFIIGRDGTRDEVVEKFARWIETRPVLMRALPELAGKRLACWCSPHRCHADVLAEMATWDSTMRESTLRYATMSEDEIDEHNRQLDDSISRP